MRCCSSNKVEILEKALVCKLQNSSMHDCSNMVDMVQCLRMNKSCKLLEDLTMTIEGPFAMTPMVGTEMQEIPAVGQRQLPHSVGREYQARRVCLGMGMVSPSAVSGWKGTPWTMSQWMFSIPLTPFHSYQLFYQVSFVT